MQGAAGSEQQAAGREQRVARSKQRVGGSALRAASSGEDGGGSEEEEGRQFSIFVRSASFISCKVPPSGGEGRSRRPPLPFCTVFLRVPIIS